MDGAAAAALGEREALLTRLAGARGEAEAAAAGAAASGSELDAMGRELTALSEGYQQSLAAHKAAAEKGRGC